MGTRPKFTFDPPEEIYAMRYAEIVKEIEADLFKWRHQVIEEIGQERHNPDACELHHFASEADKPDVILKQAYDGIMGQAAQDMVKLAIWKLADYHTTKYVRGYWPDWSKE